MTRISSIPFGLLAFLSVGVSVVSLHYFYPSLGLIPPAIFLNFVARPIPFLLHVSGGAVALTIGVWQFLPRTRKSNWHRYAGRIYVLACLIGGIAGMAVAPFSEAGPIAQSGFTVLSALWIYTTLKAYGTAQQRDFVAHRIWMWRSFGLTSAAITLRLYLGIGSILGIEFLPLYQFTAWGSWITNLFIAEGLRRWKDRRPA